MKWCDLSYEDCTWEYPGEVDRALEDEFTRHVDLYWDRRYVYMCVYEGGLCVVALMDHVCALQNTCITFTSGTVIF